MKKISEIEDEVCKLTGNTRAPGQKTKSKDEEDLRRKMLKNQQRSKVQDPNHNSDNNNRGRKKRRGN